MHNVILQRNEILSIVIIYFTFDPIIIFVLFLLSCFAVASINASIGDCEVFHDERKIRRYIDSTIRNVIIHSQFDFFFRFLLISILIVPNFWLGLLVLVASAKVRILNSLSRNMSLRKMCSSCSEKLS